MARLLWASLAWVLLLAGATQAQVQCTPENIEQMRGMGASDEQIGVLCPGLVAPPPAADPAPPPGAPPGGQGGEGIVIPGMPERGPFEGAWNVARRRVKCETTDPTTDYMGEGACNDGMDSINDISPLTWHISQQGGQIQVHTGSSFGGSGEEFGCTVGQPLAPDAMSFANNTLETQKTTRSGFLVYVTFYQLTYDPGSDTWGGIKVEFREVPDPLNPSQVYQTRIESEVILTRMQC